VLIVAAAGNDGDVMSVLGQASQEFDNIITVGAAQQVETDTVGASVGAQSLAPSPTYQRAYYSSYGRGLDILAEGGTTENPVVSTVEDSVGTMAGTSVATAKVTGAASQVWAANPQLSYRQVIEVLKSTATDLAEPGWDTQTGTGLLNLAAAVELAKTTTPKSHYPETFLTPTTWSGQGQVTPTERAANFRGRVQNIGAVVATGWLRLRSGPGTSYSEVDKIPAGTELEFDGEAYGEFVQDPYGVGGSSTWYHLADGRGYMSALYIENLGSISNPQPDLNNTVGYNGFSIHQTYVDTFNRNGGSSVLGSPINNVHPWGDGHIQDFDGGSDGRGGIMKSNANDNSYWVSGDFWNKYLDTGGSGGILDYPTSDRYRTNGGWRQNFQGGAILKSSKGIFPLFGGIGAYYFNNEGGENGRLGFPTSGEIGIGNGVIVQNFEHGRIVYGDGSTRTEMNSQPTPTHSPTSVTINGFIVDGNFYDVFENYRVTLGNPISGVTNHSSGASYQLFNNGSIVNSQYGTYPLYGGIRQSYLNTGGLNGWLGAPKSAEYSLGNGVIQQDFANGYIYWNGSRATAYTNSNETPSQPPPSNEPILSSSFQSPVRVSSASRGIRGFGQSTPDGYHTGIDIVPNNPSDTIEIYSIGSGRVIYTNGKGNVSDNQNGNAGFGNTVIVEHTLSNGSQIWSQYSHLKYNSIKVTTGQKVNQNTVLGVMGNTGYSTGNHLHFEMKKPDTQQRLGSATLMGFGYIGILGNTQGATNPKAFGYLNPDDYILGNNSSSSDSSEFSANMRAFLDTIAYAEGTSGSEGYRTIVGYNYFDNFDDHPREPVYIQSIDDYSDAAGRYQFLSTTWDGVRSKLGLSDFSPRNQDLGAVELIRQRGAFDDVENGNIEAAIEKCSWEWASLPPGRYGQPKKSMQKLLQVYQNNLANYT